ncbi:hypothetical protein BV898_13873 [Hypsibius exemplaris]|uniref:Uncharacterized protein n=1 Tax=Hypsibius exemplaris TaxID=2072580 RepID=A0A1W0W9C4_HYPEX|nr:hypothetical protein BV898_13873 [Hypsibius exemplaris]
MCICLVEWSITSSSNHQESHRKHYFFPFHGFFIRDSRAGRTDGAFSVQQMLSRLFPRPLKALPTSSSHTEGHLRFPPGSCTDSAAPWRDSSAASRLSRVLEFAFERGLFIPR